ncbi:MAG: DUF4181 domain-containing protein [Bacillaceae bacterium]|nr:DUF4181 domain-containing protein [Bacillaceae bacterium]
MKNMSLFEKDRRSAFIVIEIILIALFIAWFIVARSVFPDSKWAFSMSGFVFFFLIYLFRGIEAYAENKTDRSYYYHWSASGILLLMFLWTLTVEFILF